MIFPSSRCHHTSSQQKLNKRTKLFWVEVGSLPGARILIVPVTMLARSKLSSRQKKKLYNKMIDTT